MHRTLPNPQRANSPNSKMPQLISPAMRCDAMRNEYYKLYTCDSELKKYRNGGYRSFKKQQQQKKRFLALSP
jgi:hypothetical protein